MQNIKTSHVDPSGDADVTTSALSYDELWSHMAEAMAHRQELVSLAKCKALDLEIHEIQHETVALHSKLSGDLPFKPVSTMTNDNKSHQ